MIKTIALCVLIFSLAGGLSHYMVGYERGGAHYLARQREQRKSLRIGSHRSTNYQGGPYSSRGPRFGK